MTEPGNPLIALISRDLKLAARIGGGGVLAVIFFVIVVTFVPFGVGPQGGLLAKIAAGMLWIGVLLSVLLTLDRLYQADFEDGTLDLLALGDASFGGLALMKAIAHWLTTALPLLIATPLLSLLLALPGEKLAPMMLALLIGTPSLSLLGGIGAALTVGIRRGGLLLSLLVLPFFVPILIFGVGAANAETVWNANTMFLTAILLILIVVSPPATAAGLRLNMT